MKWAPGATEGVSVIITGIYISVWEFMWMVLDNIYVSDHRYRHSVYKVHLLSAWFLHSKHCCSWNMVRQGSELHELVNLPTLEFMWIVIR